MFFLYSKSCEYAVRVLARAAEEPKGCFGVGKVCRAARVPAHYARKAIERLASLGVLEAVRGRGGGYRFVKPVDKITILDLVRAIDGEGAFEQCVMGLPHCGNSNPCPLHETWKKVKARYVEELGRKTRADLVRLRKKSFGLGHGAKKR